MSTPRLPTWLVILALVVTVAGTLITLVGAYQIGITWDERTNMRSLQVFFEQGWNITEDALINGEPNPDYIWGIYVYGPVSLLFTHALAVLAGAENWGVIEYTSQAYAIRHVGGALIGVLGLVAAALTVRVITKSWRWAAVGAHGCLVNWRVQATQISTEPTIATAGRSLVSTMKGPAPAASVSCPTHA